MATTEQPPFINPAVPFEYVISDGFTPGKKISMEGIVPKNADRFKVELLAGSDIVFHYNPRFNENLVVRNSKLGGSWGQEEKEGPMPFKRGNIFKMKIQCEPEFFRIVVNGPEAHKYNHRYKELGQISSLKIGEDINVAYLNI